MVNNGHYDVIVIGVGSMGAAACWELARRGERVLGLDQFDIVHERGSHSGQSRIIRKAYFEHPDYVPLLERSYQKWQAFEKLTNTEIYFRTGIIYMGKASSASISGTKESSARYQIPLRDLDPQERKNTCSAFRIPGDFECFIEEDAGFIIPDRAIKLYTSEAVGQGATIKPNTAVNGWRIVNGKIEVETNQGSYTSSRLIITAGSWAQKMIPGLPTKLSVTKQILAWIKNVNPEKFSLGKFPCWFVDDADKGLYYGFPMLPNDQFAGPFGLKLALHQRGESFDPTSVDKSVPLSAMEDIRYFIDRYMPAIQKPEIEYKQCLYTYSEDSDFIIDHLPGYENQVTIACGFSGHGFKFVPVVGEVLADLATKGRTDLPVAFLGLNRLMKN